MFVQITCECRQLFMVDAVHLGKFVCCPGCKQQRQVVAGPIALPAARDEGQEAAAPLTAYGAAIVLKALGSLLMIFALIAGAIYLGLGYAETRSDKDVKKTIPGTNSSSEKPQVTSSTLPPPPPTVLPKIPAAIDRGVAYLKKQLLEDTVPKVYPNYAMTGNNTLTGSEALAGLALLEAGVSPEDPAVQKVLASVRAARSDLRLIYALGTAMFFMNKLHSVAPLGAEDRALCRTLALRLVAGQQKDGRWGYVNRPITPWQEGKLLQELAANTFVPSQPIAGTNSMTQFALIALWGSRQYGLPLRRVLLASAAHFHETQAPDGTWGYDPGMTRGRPNLRDSNTCAGLIALAMEKTLLEDTAFRDASAVDAPIDPRSAEQCKKAFAHLAKVIGRTKKDPGLGFGTIFRANASGDYYFLWCLERVAVMYDKKEIGGKDWYTWGSEVILENQRPDGSWHDGRFGDVCDTSFALLFLTRANLAKDLTESIRRRSVEN